jgi:hypothetical protein
VPYNKNHHFTLRFEMIVCKKKSVREKIAVHKGICMQKIDMQKRWRRRLFSPSIVFDFHIIMPLFYSADEQTLSGFLSMHIPHTAAVVIIIS